MSNAHYSPSNSLARKYVELRSDLNNATDIQEQKHLINSFLNGIDGAEELRNYRMLVEPLLAEALSAEGKHHEACLMLQRVIDSNKKIKSIISLKICDILLKMNQIGQAVSVILECMDTETDMITQLSLFTWLSTHVKNFDAEFANRKDQIKMIQQELGIRSPEGLNLNELVTFLKAEITRADRRFSAAKKMIFNRKTTEEHIVGLQNYIDHEEVTIYKSYAELHIQSLQNSLPKD